MKRRVLLVVMLLLTALLTMSAVSCAGRAPEISDVRDRFVELIEASNEINNIFFGDGLPVYKRGDELAERLGIYYSDTNTSYNIVAEEARFVTEDAIKYAAEKVYSEEYLSALYETAFDGVISAGQTKLRFYDDGSSLRQNVGVTDGSDVVRINERIYDYSTMEIISPSDSEYVNVRIESYTPSSDAPQTVYLSFVYQNGDWYLDSPTY